MRRDTPHRDRRVSGDTHRAEFDITDGLGDTHFAASNVRRTLRVFRHGYGYAEHSSAEGGSQSDSFVQGSDGQTYAPSHCGC